MVFQQKTSPKLRSSFCLWFNYWVLEIEQLHELSPVNTSDVLLLLYSFNFFSSYGG